MLTNCMKRLDKFSLILAMLLPLPMLSSMAAENAGASINHLMIAQTKSGELQLEARQIPLSKILNNIAQKTHIPIHYSVLPEVLVSATCVGATIKPILECLLAKKADLVFRNSQTPGKTNEIEEAWIMGSTLASYADQNKGCAAATDNVSKSLPGTEKQAMDTGRVDELLTMSKSKDPDDRANAIAALLNDEHKDDPSVKAALDKVLTDPNPSVRAQAISNLAQFEGENTTALLQEALHDESVDVRLMAVSGITADNISLLQQAINDSDENVRILATTRLEELRDSDESSSK